MHSGFNTVEHFQVQFRKLVFLVGRSLLNITERTSIYNVSDNESLDGLILRDGLSSGNTPNTLDVSTPLLITSVIASLDSHGSNAADTIGCKSTEEAWQQMHGEKRIKVERSPCC